jgi:hypothetical protein
VAPYRVPSPSVQVAHEFVYTSVGTPSSLALTFASWCRRLLAAIRGEVPRAPIDPHCVVLCVQNRELRLSFGAHPALVVNLRELLDVELDTRAIEKFHGQVRPDGVIGAGRAVALDVSRIVLVFAEEGLRVPLSEVYGSYSESLAWMGKVRQFLRVNGWVPEDERES